MLVPDRPSRKAWHLFGILGLILASGSMAEAQPSFTEVPLDAAPSQLTPGAATLNVPPGGAWTVVPPMRYSNFDPDRFDAARAPQSLAPVRLQPPTAPQEAAPAWITATQAPVPANPLGSPASAQAAASIDTAPANKMPVSMVPVNAAPAGSPPQSASNAG